MPPTSSFDTAREALDQTIGELQEQLKQAEAARAALGGGKSARRGPGRPPAAREAARTKPPKPAPVHLAVAASAAAAPAPTKR